MYKPAVVKMNLSDRQMSRLRNGHSVRVLPNMVGSGTDVIIDPMTYNNLMKHMKKNKGMMVALDADTIEMNKMEGSGIFKKLKKAGRSIKRAYNKNVKNTKLGQALRDTAGQLIEVPYDLVATKLDNQYTGDIADYMKDNRERNIDTAVRKTGLGFGKKLRNVGRKIKRSYNKNVKDTALGQALRDSAREVIEKGYDRVADKIDNRFTGDIADYMRDNRERNVGTLVRKTGLGLRMQKSGSGLKVGAGGAKCAHCGSDIGRDKFLFMNQSI